MQGTEMFYNNNQIEQIQPEHVGTGFADLKRFERAVKIISEKYTSYSGHYPRIHFFAMVELSRLAGELRCHAKPALPLKKKYTLPRGRK